MDMRSKPASMASRKRGRLRSLFLATASKSPSSNFGIPQQAVSASSFTAMPLCSSTRTRSSTTSGSLCSP